MVCAGESIIFYNGFKELGTHGAVTDERYRTILSTMAEMKTAIEELKGKPAKRWESVVEKVILLVVAGVVGFLLAQIGIG